MTATILQFPTARRVLCDPQLPPDYEPYQTSEQREAERMRSFDAADAYARRRDPTLPSTYQPTRTVEKDESDRRFIRDHAAAFAKRRQRDNDDGPQAA